MESKQSIESTESKQGNHSKCSKHGNHSKSIKQSNCVKSNKQSIKQNNHSRSVKQSTRSKKPMRKYFENFAAMTKQGEFICPFSGPCNAFWNKAADSKFGEEFNRLVPANHCLWSLSMATLTDSKIPDSLREWTRIGFHLKYWEEIIQNNPKFLKFIVSRGCRPFKEIMNKGQEYEFSLVYLTFLSEYQRHLLRCFK